MTLLEELAQRLSAVEKRVDALELDLEVMPPWHAPQDATPPAREEISTALETQLDWVGIDWVGNGSAHGN